MSGPAHVSRTRMFARFDGHGAQCLIYSMALAARQDTAMILPVPVREGAVRFTDLSSYADIFDDLERLFPSITLGARGGGDVFDGAEDELAVERVGAFDASFVPSRADFTRLDKRFRLDERVWSALPDYSRFGFAVFQLRAGESDVHPMAFSWRTSEARVFFPTVHVHDGAVHAEAAFDHTLYLQVPSTATIPGFDWNMSDIETDTVVDVTRAAGLVTAHKPVHKYTISGTHKNEDTWVRLG